MFERLPNETEADARKRLAIERGEYLTTKEQREAEAEMDAQIESYRIINQSQNQ